MNCKPGQMAMVVSGEPPINHGRVVRVLALIPNPFGDAIWTYEGTLVNALGFRADGVWDSCLRPLRDDFEPEDITTDVPDEVVA